MDVEKAFHLFFPSLYNSDKIGQIVHKRVFVYNLFTIAGVPLDRDRKMQILNEIPFFSDILAYATRFEIGLQVRLLPFDAFSFK